MIERLQEHIILNFPSNETSLRYFFGKKKVFSTADVFYLCYFAQNDEDENSLESEAFSSYEHPKSKEMLSLLNERFWKTIQSIQPRGEGLKICENVTLGCLPLGTLNARSMKGPNGDYIILLNDGLFPLVRCFAEIFVLSIKDNEVGFMIPSGDSLKSAIENKQIAALFEEAFKHYLLTGSVEGIGSEDICIGGRHRFEIASCIVHSLMIFVLAHEYGHIFYGHVDGIKQAGGSKDSRGQVETWSQELSCDNFATLVTVYYDNFHVRKGVSLSSLGINIFFLLDEFLHFSSGINAEETHEIKYPPSHLRGEMCLRKIHSLVSYEDYKITLDIWNDLINLFNGLRSAIKNPFDNIEEIEKFLDLKQRRGSAIVNFCNSYSRGDWNREEGQGQKIILY